MSLSETIAPHLPYLRRYARALTGSQESGDSYVAALLESLIANPAILTKSKLNPKATLYYGLSKLWGSVKINLTPDPSVRWEAAAKDRLMAIPAMGRQAFLLTSLEGFSVAQAGEILGQPEQVVSAELHKANQHISEMLAGKVMIIEDEPLIALDLQDIVEELGHKAVGVARTHAEAVKLAAKTKPDLVLSDIQLADGSSGIDAVTDILKSYDVPVIFITAFPERLLTGERPEPAFLITKPFSPETVKALVAQALFFKPANG